MTSAVVSRFGGPDVIELSSTKLADFGAEDVLIRVEAASVTPLDTMLRAGVSVGSYKPPLPYVPGNSISGIVEAIGPAVKAELSPGLRVFATTKTGGYAERAIAPAEKVYRIPNGIDPAAAALIAVPYRTAFHALVDLADAKGGETVLVHGAGGSVGAAAVQIARAHGLHIIATCGPEHHAHVLEDGAHAVVNHRDDEWPDAVRAAAGGRAMAVIIEVAAHANLAADLDLVAPRGRIVIVGGHGSTTIDSLPVIGKGLSIHGVSLPSILPGRDREIMAAICAGLENRTFRPRCALTFPLARAADAHRAIEAGRGSGGVALVMEN